MTILGKVTRPAGQPRGADVCWRVDVGRGALAKGARFLLAMPRRLPCALCQGGGCDACERRGAITLREAEEAEETLQVALSEDIDHDGVCLRIPDRGGPGADGVARGDLELTLTEADVASDCVLDLELPEGPRSLLKSPLLPWAVLPVLLSLVYLLLSAR